MLVWAAIAALQARSQLKAIQSSLAATVSASSTTNVDSLDATVVTDLGRARRAQATLSQLGPRLVAEVPILGRNWAAERAVADPAVATLTMAHTLLPEVHGLSNHGSVNLTVLGAVHHQMASASAQVVPAVGHLDRVNTSLTFPGVGRNVVKARTIFNQVSSGLQRGVPATAAAATMLGADGPRTLIIALQNNGELRGTGGLIGSFAVAHTVDGHLSIGTFQDVDSISALPSQAKSVPAPAAYVQAFGRYQANTTLWKNVNMSSDAPASSAVLANVVMASTGTRADGVLLLDVPAAVGLLTEAEVGVRLPNGTTASGPSLTQDLLVDSYGSATSNGTVELARRMALEAGASAAVRQALAKPFGIPVIKALATAASGNHLVLWSRDTATEGQLTAAGVSGAIQGSAHDIAMISANNFGDSPGVGNKLDTFAHRSITVQVAVGTSQASVSETVSIHNETPDGLGPYIAGIRYPGRLDDLYSFAMGQQAHITGLTVDGETRSSTVTALGTGRQLLTYLVVPRGQTGTIQISYTIPVHNGHYTLQLMPQALAYPAQLTVGIGAAQGASLTSPAVRFSQPWTSTKTVSVTVK